MCGVHFKRVPTRQTVLLRRVVQWMPWQTSTVGGNAELFAM